MRRELIDGLESSLRSVKIIKGQMKENMLEILSEDNINIHDIEQVRNLYRTNKNEFISLTKSVLNELIEEILYEEAECYYYKNVAGCVDYCEDMVNNDTTTIEFQHDVEELNEENYDRVLQILNNFNIISNGDAKVLEEDFEFEVDFSCQYPNPMTDGEIDGTCEFTITYRVDLDSFADNFSPLG